MHLTVCFVMQENTMPLKVQVLLLHVHFVDKVIIAQN